jgi:hypothetical protein
MKLSENNAGVCSAAPILSFGVRLARPQNSRRGSCEIGADFPSETVKNIFEFSRPLAQKQPSRVPPLDKIIPQLARNRKILRENGPPVWKKCPKT